MLFTLFVILLLFLLTKEENCEFGNASQVDLEKILEARQKAKDKLR